MSGTTLRLSLLFIATPSFGELTGDIIQEENLCDEAKFENQGEDIDSSGDFKIQAFFGTDLK